jgi:ring-1,2-phenylacetyl-CoA epoxidase subunit PaaB
MPTKKPVATPATSPVLEPFEVFQQAKEGDPMRHGGNVLAPDADLAMHYARELYGRRQESHRLWIVRRSDITVLEDQDLLQPPLDRSFKKPGGYVMRDKLEAARAKAGTSKPQARAEGHDRTGGRRSG